MLIKTASQLLSALLLSGCAAALVPYTSDPYKKIEYAYSLWRDQRPQPAERLGKEALADFEKDNDIFGQAEAHHFLGNFYKSREYKNVNFFPSYDPTSKTSINHFEKATVLYKQEKDMWGASKAIFSMANAYSIDKNLEKSCELLNESLRTYKSAVLTPDSRGRTHLHTHNPNFKDMESMIRGFMKHENCSEK
jgi:tetratricopeptide (TPR) repeat protein